MRQLHRFISLVIITIIIITIFFFLNSNESINNIDGNKIQRYTIHQQYIDNYTLCLLDMNQALNSLFIPWFVTHGTALMYWRSKNFISDDIDIGIFYEDLRISKYNEKNFLSIMKKKYHFQLSHSYGQIDHGQEWTFSCPQSRIKIDIFVFYSYNETNSSFAYWAASYNGLCDEMIYKKCRWKFSKFNLTTFKMYGKIFYIVPLEFIIERYGNDYIIPRKYDYFESLKILPNLILEYDNQTKKNIWRKGGNKYGLKYRRKGRRRRIFIL